MGEKGWTDFFPGTRWVPIGQGIEWRLHKHWGQGVWAGEGLFSHNGDGSGCLTDFDILGRRIDRNRPIYPTTSKPIVVCQRIYRKGSRQLSAVFSYPHGLSIIDEYFWELYPVGDNIERFDTEEEMESKIKKILK